MTADLPVEAPVYVERPPAIGLLNWTGFYFGANLGPGSMDIFVGGLPVLSLSDTMSGVIGGIQAGANWQTGNAVFRSRETSRAQASRFPAQSPQPT